MNTKEFLDELIDEYESHATLSEKLSAALNEIARLRELAASAYAGLVGTYNLPEKWADAFYAASSGEDFSSENLLPVVLDITDPDVWCIQAIDSNNEVLSENWIRHDPQCVLPKQDSVHPGYKSCGIKARYHLTPFRLLKREDYLK